MSLIERCERCSNCGALGRIDEDQAEGRVSIICSECGYHYIKGDKDK